MKMQDITGALLNQAVAIYTQHAFRGQAERARNLPRFAEAQSLAEILAGKHPFEDLTGGMPSTLAAEPVPLTGGSLPRVYALRLGNIAYPHMKLALVEAYFADEFVFAVDRHDTFHFEPNVPGYEAWCELKEINRLVKESIEDSWHKAGVPTFRGLREKAFKHPDLVRQLMREGQTLMVLDDDEARADILKGVLAEDGYAIVGGPAGPPPAPSEQDAFSATVCDLVREHRVALVVLDVSYLTGQGPRVAGALRLDARSQAVPILGIYSRRDFGPDPDLFDAALRRPYRKEALLELVHTTLVSRGRGGSGIHNAVL
ncbi:MAG: hypothetical protein AMXMBFR7_36640 [Planctomycetota bacterium]